MSIGASRRGKDYFGEDTFANESGHSDALFRYWWRRVVARSRYKIRGNMDGRLFFNAPKEFR
jgi:hypothetical protein